MRWLLDAWLDATLWAGTFTLSLCAGLVLGTLANALEMALESRKGMDEFRKRSAWADRFHRWPRSRMFW